MKADKHAKSKPDAGDGDGVAAGDAGDGEGVSEEEAGDADGESEAGEMEDIPLREPTPTPDAKPCPLLHVLCAATMFHLKHRHAYQNNQFFI